MKRLFTLLMTLGITAAVFGQSTTGWKPVFQEDFANNKAGWSQNESTVNTSKIVYDMKVLLLRVNDDGDRRSDAYTRFDFNEDFILKTVMGAKTDAKGGKNDPTKIGIIFGNTSHKYVSEQGWYAVYLDFFQDVVTIRASNENGSQLYEKTVTDASYDIEGKTEIGVKKEGSKVTFYLNGKSIFENVATTTSGGAITFIAKKKVRGLFYSVDIYEKDIPPTPEEVAEVKAIAAAVSKEEESVIVEAVSNLEFATGKATISDKSVTALNKMAEMMVKNTKFKVILKGHTDDVGDGASNLKLSQDRVNSVIAYLVGKGIDKSRLVGLGYGDKQPIADNETPEGRQKNRRVEFEIVL